MFLKKCNLNRPNLGFSLRDLIYNKVLGYFRYETLLSYL